MTAHITKRQAPAIRSAPAGDREDRWRPALRRGTAQDDPGIPSAAGDRRRLRPRRSAAAARDPGHPPRLADGAAGSPERRPRGGPGLRGARPGVQLRADSRGDRDGRCEIARGAQAAHGRRADSPTRSPSPGTLHLQAFTHSGHRLRVAAREHAAAASSAHRPGARRAVPGRRRVPTGTARVPLHGRGVDRAGDPVLAPSGERAAARLGNVEAIGHLGTGLELLATLPRRPSVRGRSSRCSWRSARR